MDIKDRDKQKIDSIVTAINNTTIIDSSNSYRVVDVTTAKDLKDIANSDILYLFSIASMMLLFIQYGSLLVVDLDKVDIQAVNASTCYQDLDDILGDASIANIADIL